ncbi:MAG: TfoX/Sxy family protein [Planctomycetes bacterium]|nr:TfoX/Sxy family protein [Planctomycetota bacterium]
MAYDDSLAQRIRSVLVFRKNIVEKKMFGGLGFLLQGNMLVGVWKNSLIVRLEPSEYETALAEPFVKTFDITGRPMRGWVLVESDGVLDEDSVDYWVQRAIAFVSQLPRREKSSEKGKTRN